MEVKRTIESHIGALILVFTTIILFVEIVLRYFFNSSLIWGEEIARYLFIWFIYISMSYSIVDRSHIKIDSMMKLIPEKYRIYFTQIGIIIWIIFASVITYFTMTYTLEALEKNQNSVASGIPMWLIFIGIPLGFILSIIRLIIEFINNIKIMRLKKVEE